MRVFLKRLQADLLEHFRLKIAVFWEFLFPVVMMLLFFLAFGGEEGGVSLKVGVVDLDRSGLSGALVGALREVPIFELAEGDGDELQARLEAGKLDGLVIIPQGFQTGLGRGGAQLRLLVYGGESPQTREILVSAVQRLIDEFNARVVPPPITIAQETVTPGARASTDLDGISYVDFVLPGILATAVLATALMSGAIGLAVERENKLLKHLRTTPLRPVVFFAARALQEFIVSVLQAVLIVGLAVLLMGARVQGSYPLLFLLFTVAMFAFIMMGFAVAAFSRSHEAATGLANIFYMPMVFASGAFFPIGGMPGWLQPVMKALPLRFFLDGFRAIAVRGAGLAEIALDLGVLALWGLICLLITVRFFRWGEE